MADIVDLLTPLVAPNGRYLAPGTVVLRPGTRNQEAIVANGLRVYPRRDARPERAGAWVVDEDLVGEGDAQDGNTRHIRTALGDTTGEPAAPWYSRTHTIAHFVAPYAVHLVYRAEDTPLHPEQRNNIHAGIKIGIGSLDNLTNVFVTIKRSGEAQLFAERRDGADPERFGNFGTRVPLDVVEPAEWMPGRKRAVRVAVGVDGTVEAHLDGRLLLRGRDRYLHPGAIGLRLDGLDVSIHSWLVDQRPLPTGPTARPGTSDPTTSAMPVGG